MKIIIFVSFSTAMLGGIVYAQMYDPNSHFGVEHISKPTQEDIMRARHSSFVHGQAAAEAMSREDTWGAIHEQELANKARNDERDMMLRMEQNRIEELNRRKREEELNRREEDNRRQDMESMQNLNKDLFSMSPIVKPDGTRLCPICGKKRLKAKQQRCKKCVRMYMGF